ncbi:MAG TPA: gamma-glutamyl-gamma-aminobutyrate hydrolase family protein [Longimicrobiaceae bacterium]|nr:gamma-glutamyl-gamma-aminobutyrate hydrolase family protein [Longimicrobiaceae bacterium]
MPERRRIGLTMRTDSPAQYDEPRDGLARDWAEFLAFALPELLWLPVPNLGAAAVEYARELEIEGLILTGGADPATDRLRDETEEWLLREAAARALPVFGVCRGLQMLLRFLGAPSLERVPECHIARRHQVRFLGGDSDGVVEVNSFHRYGLREERLPAACEPLAVAEDGWVEAVRATSLPFAGAMWHPERERPFRALDRRLIRRIFALE